MIGQFTFYNGYLFYGNNVIKIRYDLLDKYKLDYYTEEQIFDIYSEIFDLDDNIKVKIGTPLDSMQAHRYAYIFSDTKMEHANTIYIVPYLQERRIYLNRIKKNTDYFYTSIETDVKE